jgi:hypothetical protein
MGTTAQALIASPRHHSVLYVGWHSVTAVTLEAFSAAAIQIFLDPESIPG